MLATLVLCAPLAATASDWPMWRGPTYNGHSEETGLVESWSPKGGEGSNLLWKNEALAGRSTPIVLGDRLYTILRDQPGTEHEGEKIVCVSAATGEVKWEHRFNVYLSDVPDTRVGWSSVVGDPETGYVYAQGVCGYFCCLVGETGRVVWERSLHEEMGLLSTYGGRTNFPLIYQDTVITSAVVIGWGDSPKWGLLAKPAHRFLGLDKKTGELRWLGGTRLIPYDTTYSTPSLVTLAGQEALVFGSGDGAVWAMQPGTGKTLWKHQLSRRGLNVSPVVSPEGRVFTSHGEENIVGNTMGAVVAVDGNAVGDDKPTDLTESPLWKRFEIVAGKSSPLLIENRLYVVNDAGKMLILDTESGESVINQPIKLGRVMRGSPLYADGKIYACTRGGVWNVLKPTEAGVEKLVFDRRTLRGHQVDASPIAAHGRIYLTTSKGMFCIGSPDAPAIEALEREAPEETAVTDKKATHAQLVPWDTLLAPGDEQQYRVRLYNASGQFLREAKPEKVSFGVAGIGEVSPEGVYRAPKKAGHRATRVLCEVNGFSAEARVRIVPPLPWSFDFDNGKDVPLTWVGGRIRYVTRGEEGKHYIAKPTELPTRPGAPTTKLGTRSRMWMGPHTMSDYTVQADIQLQEGVAGESSDDAPAPEFPAASSATNIKLPTAGLINSRYTFALFGPSNEARLYSWCTHDKRTQASTPIELEAGVWYRMKLTVVPKPKDGHAHMQAKVWRRGEPEPGEWTLEFQDDAPNLQGSPGLFGDAKEAEFYVDNLKVTPNS